MDAEPHANGIPYDQLLDELVVETLRSYAELWIALDGATRTLATTPGTDALTSMTSDTERRFTELAMRGGVARVTGAWT